jgi:hypothetical protein
MWWFSRRSAVPPEAPTAFFSYSREDSDFALRLAQDLKAAGANVWIDQLDIQPGQEWDNAIEAAVAQSPRMLLILSPASVKSRNVRNEISFALDENKIIIPVLYQDCAVPLQLRRVQYIDLRTDYSRGIDVLLGTLGVDKRPAAGAQAVMTEPYADEAGLGQERTSPKQHRPPTENQPFVLQPRDGLVRRFPGGMKAVVALCLILIAASILYWNLSQSRERRAEGQNQQAQDEEKKPGGAETFGSPLSSQPTSNTLVGERQQPEVPTGAAKTASAKSAPRESRGVPQGGQPNKDQTATLVSQDGGARAANPMQPASSNVPSEGALPADLDPGLADVYRRAQGGETYALVAIGDAYRFQHRDFTKAVAWYRKAAAAGSSFGMTSLGKMYEDGLGVDKDYKQAVNWYRKAADAGSDQGSRDGMYYLGVMYENGWGVSQDREQAIVWYRKAANLGLGNAELALKRLGESPK